MELKRLRYSGFQEDRHCDLMVSSLLNFSESYNFEPSFRLHKRSSQIAENSLKLAPIQTLAEGVPHFRTDTFAKSVSALRQENKIPNSIKSTKYDSNSENLTSLTELPLSHSLQIITQPVSYQIANYNIHPPPALTVDRSITQNITVHAQLVENDRKTVVDGGFQSGDVRVLRAGHTTLYFTGLKLNKMGPIKTELHFRDYKRIPTTFCIQFKVGARCIYSEPFKLVSSCAQLPHEIRDIVRPTKKNQRTESPETIQHETSQSSSPISSDPDEGETELRKQLEDAIQSANVEAAAIAAKQLAYVKGVCLAKRQRV